MAGQDNKEKDSGSEISGENVDPSEPEQNSDVNVSEEYDFLDSKLDDLNSALDFLEKKNDDIQERLKELLQSNRDIRQQLQNENNNDHEMEVSNP